MFFLENLLRNEYFPLELPECFSTNDFADKANKCLLAANAFNHKYSIPVKYSGYKSESSRRKFSIPNPYHYIKAVNIIVENKESIFEILKKSKYSLTAPVDRRPSKTQAYTRKSVTVMDTKKAIETQYKNNRYEIRLDISSFFDSIYTHSIPWAIHGINQAKRNRNDKNLLGNVLDEHMRAMNYDQTNGILVGNALSRIISEILLCTIDEQIQKKFPYISCCRFVDDYYIYTKNSAEIQEIISYIRTKLAQYELSFNENKIQINESPFLYGKPWVEEIKQYIYLPSDVFLTRLIIEFRTHKDISIIKYGLKVILSYDYNSTNWKVMQSRLLNLWVRFPSLADKICPILWKNKHILKKADLKESIYSVINETLLLHKDQELIWAIWFVKIFDINLSQSYIIKVLSSDNDIAKIILLDIISNRNLLKQKKIKQELVKLRDFLISLDLNDRQQRDNLMWSQHWLLAYEADLNKWLNIDGKTFEIARKNQFFKELIKDKIKFYDPNFSYNEINHNNSEYKYVTSTKLHNEFKKLILIKEKNNNSDDKLVSGDIENELYNKFVDILENDTDIY